MHQLVILFHAAQQCHNSCVCINANYTYSEQLPIAQQRQIFATHFSLNHLERNCPKQIAPKSSSEPDAVWGFTIRRWSRQSSCGGSHHTISRPNISNCNLNQLLMPHQMVLCSTDPHSGCSPFTSKGKITFFVIFSPPYSNKINPFVWSRFWFEEAEMGNQNAFL